MKKFRTTSFDSIAEFEIIKETDKQVIYLNASGIEKKESKSTDWHSWFETKQDAKEFLESRCLQKIKILNDQLNYASERLAKIKEL